MTITVENVEEPGVVTIDLPRGWDGTAFRAELTDDDGGITNEVWQWERSPNGRSGWTAISGAISYTYSATTNDVGQYLRATVSYEDARGSNKEASAAVTGRIEAAADRPITNTTPAFSEATTTRSVSAGATPGRNVGSRVTATDSDQGDVLTYSLLGEADAAAFDIDPATGQIRTRAVLVHDPDPDGDNTYEVTVSVHDGFDGAYIPSDASDATIDVTITVTAGRRGGGGGGGGGPSNQPPVFADGPSTEREVAENAAAGADVGPPVTATGNGILTHTLGGADAGSFAIVAATGQIQVGDGTVLDHEAEKNTYVVEVTATDPAGATAMIAVTISVTNQPEPGTVTLSPATPVVDAELTAALYDPDGGVTGVTWQWARSADPDGWTDIPGATSMGYTPMSVDIGHHLRAAATYTDALAPGQTAVRVTDHAVTEGDPLVARYDANKNGMIERGEVIAAINDYLFGEGDEAISRAEVIRLINLYLFGGGGGTPSNQPPVFADGPSTEREVAENAAAGENVGEPVAATDTDTLTHTLGGADAGYFAIAAATGQIQVGDGTVLDHEAEKNTYVVEVTATDPAGATAMIAVTISVTNQPEPGTVTLSPATPVVDAELTAALYDPDGGVTGVTWQWARSADPDGWTDIPGATSTGYTPTSVDLGHHLRATATYTDALAPGQTAVGVTGQAVTEGDPLVARYDANANGTIERGEVIAAINDYLFGEGAGAISRAEVIRLINLYLFG